MGAKFHFSCKCGYEVDTCASDYDYGMRAALTTIHCKQCKKIRDVMVAEAPEWDFNSGPEGWIKYPLACPNKRHSKFEVWTSKNPVCPKCGATMLMDERGILLWD
jgi:hypothetical protein